MLLFWLYRDCFSCTVPLRGGSLESDSLFVMKLSSKPLMAEVIVSIGLSMALVVMRSFDRVD